MEHLGIDESVLIGRGAINTAREIEGQPVLWKKTWQKIANESGDISSFLGETLPQVQRIILTGAGTSAFIGLSLKGKFQKAFGKITEVIPTTDLVSNPEDFLIRDVPTLMVSFARSGNSPESVAAVMLADQHVSKCHHLFITCDPSGKLARHATRLKNHLILMPEEANDKSLAMTGSYSSMLLTGILIAEIDLIRENEQIVNTLSEISRLFITSKLEIIRKIAEADFDRAIFLGSGPLYGVATESHLKLQELTDGKVICKHESFLGFRHGPKAVTNNKALIIYLLSNNSYVRKYEIDLIQSMAKGQQALMEAGVSETRFNELPLDHFLYFSEDEVKLTDEYFCMASILPAQLIGFFKSWNLGLSPDAPSTSGAISRVVEGVKIYGI
ncbi:MAG: SIS domain-containing protein [Bacteroidales bacterium]|nr:SIS domain-containing protein [Bacteroidales bacterium]